MKTIKQIADELQLDKQKVYRYIKRNHITEAHQDGQVKWYDEAAEKLIKSAFIDNTKSSEALHEADQTTSEEAVLKQSEKDNLATTLQTTIDILHKQLEVKDSQIEALNERLAEAQQLLHQQQQLNAIAEQKILALEAKENQESEPEPNQKKWYQFWK